MDDAARLEALEAEVAELAARLDRIERVGASAAPARAAVAAPPASPPVPPRPTTRAAPPREPEPPRTPIDLEDLLGGRVLAWVGGAAVVLGVVFFLVMAVSNGWIDEPTRTVLAFLGSTALLAVGVWLFEAKGQTDAAVAAVAAAIAALYASVTTATQVYDLLAPGVGLAVAALVGGAATAIAVRWQKRGIAALGILGALLAPVLVDAGTSRATLAFMALALVSATGVLIWQRWDWLALGAYVLSAPQLVVWVYDSRNDPLATTLAALALFWAVYVVAATGYELRVPTSRLRPSSGGLLVGNALLVSGLGWYALDHQSHAGAATAWVAGVAATHVLLGSAGLRGRMSREIALVLLAVAIGLSAVAVALALDGPAVVAAWCAEAVLLTWLGARSGAQRSYVAAAVFLVLATIHVATADAEPGLLTQARDDWTPAVAVALVTIAALACRVLYAGRPAEARFALEGLAAAGIVYLPPLVFEGVEVGVAWAGVAVALAAYARMRDEEHLAYGSLGFVGLAAAHALAVEVPPDALRVGVDDIAVAVLALAAVAISAVAAERLVRGPVELRRALGAAAALSVLYLASIAIVDLTSSGDSFEPGQTPQVLLSTFWALTGLAGVVVGLVRNVRTARFGGLALLGIAVVKVALYDLSNLDSAYRALSFVALGLLLLAGAYAYQRLRVVAATAE
jgi:uncharacterized membrane protein